MNEWDVIARTVAALLAGGAIGLERSFHGRAAGLRTYALVCFGSALLVAAAHYEFTADVHGSGARLPSRPPGSTSRAGGISASRRPSSSPA